MAGCCPLCRKLPAELSAATQLTSFVLSDPEVTQLINLADALPRSLRGLRLTEDDIFDDNPEYVNNDEATLPWDFGRLVRLQQLQVTVRSWGLHCMPTG